MTLYTILRKEGDKTEFYFPHEDFSLDNWTSFPNQFIWNTALIAIALHIAAVERKRERVMGTNRTIQIQATQGIHTWIVDEKDYCYAGQLI